MGQSKSSTRWADCKKALRECSEAGLIQLVQDLYRLSDENRQLIHARLRLEGTDDLLQQTQDKLRKLISYTSVLNGRFQHKTVKHLIDQFAKASGDNVAVARLLTTDLYEALGALKELGDVTELVDHSFSIMNYLDKVLHKTLPAQRRPLIQQLIALAEMYGRSFGYGLSDSLLDMASDWKDRTDEGPLEAV